MSENSKFHPEVPGVPKEGPLAPSTDKTENRRARGPSKIPSASEVPPGATEHPRSGALPDHWSDALGWFPERVQGVRRALARVLSDWPSVAVLELAESEGITMLEPMERMWLTQAAWQTRRALTLIAALDAALQNPADEGRWSITLIRNGALSHAWFIRRHGHIALVAGDALGAPRWFDLLSGELVMPEPGEDIRLDSVAHDEHHRQVARRSLIGGGK